MKKKVAAIAVSIASLGVVVPVIAPQQALAANMPNCTFKQEASGNIDGCIPHRWWLIPFRSHSRR